MRPPFYQGPAPGFGKMDREQSELASTLHLYYGSVFHCRKPESTAQRMRSDKDDEPSTLGLFVPVIAGSEGDKYHFTHPKVV